MNKEEYKTNLSILEDNNINLTSEKIWDDEPFSVELETYTDAGEDMIINLEEPTKECLQSYIEDFDVNENVMMWWRNGKDEAHQKGVPFDNIKDHYDDYKSFLTMLREVCNLLPY